MRTRAALRSCQEWLTNAPTNESPPPTPAPASAAQNSDVPPEDAVATLRTLPSANRGVGGSRSRGPPAVGPPGSGARAPGVLEGKVGALVTREIVTEFFRTAVVWQILAEEVLPRLRERAPLTIWSAGCGSGEEAWSMAILLDARFPGLPVSIVATEVDEALHRSAVRGRYASETLGDLAACLAPLGLADAQARYFRQEPDGAHVVAERLRGRVEWRRADLTADVPAAVDVVLARNVWRHLPEVRQRTTIELLRAAMPPAGRLILGGADLLGPRPGVVKPKSLADLCSTEPVGLSENFVEAEHALIYAPRP
jgi:chemotaxis methyl-accepting protein methylase